MAFVTFQIRFSDRDFLNIKNYKPDWPKLLSSVSHLLKFDFNSIQKIGHGKYTINYETCDNRLKLNCAETLSTLVNNIGFLELHQFSTPAPAVAMVCH